MWYTNSYAQELPSRFLKEVTAAADKDKDGYISIEETEKLLENIGAKGSLSTNEVNQIMDEIGSKEGDKGVPIKDIISYLKKPSN